jgi:hypothetical protein
VTLTLTLTLTHATACALCLQPQPAAHTLVTPPPHFQLHGDILLLEIPITFAHTVSKGGKGKQRGLGSVKEVEFRNLLKLGISLDDKDLSHTWRNIIIQCPIILRSRLP